MPTTGFANGTGIPTIPDASSAVMQSFVLSGAVGRITGVSITLSGLSHAVPDDLDFVLFGPLARSNLVFWSDVGGSGGFSFGHFTISDAGAMALPDGPFTTFGQPFKPANYGTPPETAANFGAVSTDLNHPGTSGSATFYTAFSGVDPNGTWMLYVRDDTGANFGSLSGWSVSITTAAVAADFDRNLVKDILWRHDDGTVVAWLLNSGGGFTTRALGAPDASWRIAETGELNNDARSDILWRNNDGTVVSWLLNASGIGATQTLGAPDNSWRIAETADFNYDSRSDILWRNDDGTVVTWLMNETSGLVSQTVGNPGSAWHINEVGDFTRTGVATSCGATTTEPLSCGFCTKRKGWRRRRWAIRVPAGASKAPAISTGTARPISSGAIPMAPRPSGCSTAMAGSRAGRWRAPTMPGRSKTSVISTAMPSTTCCGGIRTARSSPGCSIRPRRASRPSPSVRRKPRGISRTIRPGSSKEYCDPPWPPHGSR